VQRKYSGNRYIQLNFVYMHINKTPEFIYLRRK